MSSEHLSDSNEKIVPPDGRLIECEVYSRHLRDAKNSLSNALVVIGYDNVFLYDEVVELYKRVAFILWAMSRGRKSNV